MPYYLYKMDTPDDLQLVRRLELVRVFETFKPARDEARRLREACEEEGMTYKVMFAENQLMAEEQLLEKREKPVLMEHER